MMEPDSVNWTHALTYRTITEALRQAEGVGRFTENMDIARSASRVADALSAFGYTVVRRG
jgi:hypothetical protein